MLLYVLDREMNAVATMSNDIEGTMYIDDTSGGQTITLTSGCAIGSYDFKTDPYHKDSVYIKAGNFIAFTDKYDRTRMYTIMSVDGDDELDVHCEDIGLDLINEMANSWSTGTDQTLDFYLNQVIGNSSWKVVYESDGLSTQTRNLTFDNNTDTNLTRLESIMSSFGFECDFQITLQWMEVKSMEIHVYEKLYNRSENDIAQTFIDSLNLVSLTRSESLEDLYTAVLPTGGSADGKTVDISDIVYDDGQYFTTKGDNVLYDRTMAQKWNRYAGTPNANNGKYDYIYGHYSSSTTSAATLFEEALADLKEHHDVKLSYEAELLDLDADLGDYITIVDHTKQQDVYLKARIQEVTNYYSISGADKGTLANYTIMSSTNGDSLREIVNKIGDKVSALATTTLYFTLDTQGSYAPIKAEWSRFKPLEIPDGYWMWIKTVKVYQNGVEEVTYTSTKDQIDYIGPETVVSRTRLYFLSTSASKALKPDGSEATDDDWSETQPSYESGKYFWSREKVVWSAGTVMYTWALYDRQLTEASQKALTAQKEAENIQVGGRNLIKLSNMLHTIEVDSGINLLAEYELTTALTVGQQYTCSIWASSNAIRYKVCFDDDESHTVGVIDVDANGKGSVTFTMPSTISNATHLDIFVATTIIIPPETVSEESDDETDTTDTSETTSETETTDETPDENYYWINKIKLEIGNKATDFTVAPEDVSDKINTTNNRIDQTDAKVDSNTSSIDGINQQITDITSEDGIISIAQKQAWKAQEDIDAFKIYIEHGLEANFNTLNKQIVAAGDQGVMIYDSEDSQNYAHITNQGMDIYVGNNMVASFQKQSTIQELVIRKNLYFGNHIVQPFTVSGEAGTAFFWDATAQS